MWSVYAVGYRSAINNDEIMPSAERWVGLWVVTLSEGG